MAQVIRNLIRIPPCHNPQRMISRPHFLGRQIGRHHRYTLLRFVKIDDPLILRIAEIHCIIHRICHPIRLSMHTLR
jgi:hypothetical protein